MALRAFCGTCGRTVFLAEDDTQVCPVCSTPLLEAVPAGDDPASEVAPPDAQPGGR